MSADLQIPAAATSTDRGESLHEHALRLRSLRMELLAGNIANADTPNYKARDIDFRAELQRATSQQGVVGTSRTANLEPTLLYRQPSQPSLDGNTVDMDAERAAFAQNTLMYQFTFQRVSGVYKEMSELFKTLTI